LPSRNTTPLSYAPHIPTPPRAPSALNDHSFYAPNIPIPPRAPSALNNRSFSHSLSRSSSSYITQPITPDHHSHHAEHRETPPHIIPPIFLSLLLPPPSPSSSSLFSPSYYFPSSPIPSTSPSCSSCTIFAS
jgi:hypothetical protein